MVKIAIKANPERGSEIIKLLESLGGNNIRKWKGNGTRDVYYIKKDGTIAFDLAPIDYKIYSLEEFEKEFPFKVGDLCVYHSPISRDIVVRVLGFFLEKDKIMYEVGHRDATEGHSYIYRERYELTPYKEMKGERNVTLTLDKAKEWYKKGGELREIALQAFTEKELNPFPRSWEEFCRKCGYVCLSTRHTNLSLKYDALIKLEQLRNCWRQGWVPSKGNTGYCITHYPEEYSIMQFCFISFLSFPTEETAEEFLECFRDLIEQAEDLI